MAERALSADWPRRFFRRAVFDPGAAEPVAAARAEARFVWRALGLRRGSRVLDVACGAGRHARWLARWGAVVVGVDDCPEYLSRARLGAGARATFLRRDMRKLTFRGEFDAAICLWTSFGYFKSPKEDRRVLRGVARALKSGGLFLIDVVDGSDLRRRLIPRDWSERSDGSFVLQETRLLGGRDPRVLTDWTVVSPHRRPLTASSTVRAYDRRRLGVALRAAGLRPVRSWSDFPPPAQASSGRGSGARLVVLSAASLGGFAAK